MNCEYFTFLFSSVQTQFVLLPFVLRMEGDEKMKRKMSLLVESIIFCNVWFLSKYGITTAHIIITIHHWTPPSTTNITIPSNNMVILI